MFVRLAEMIISRANKKARERTEAEHPELSRQVMREFKRAMGYTQNDREHLDCLDFMVKNNLSQDIRKGILAYYGSVDPEYVQYLRF